MKKEKRGIYNVTFNEKKSTPINTELEAIENAIIDYVIHYVKGWHNIKRDKGLGAEHIKIHLEPDSKGRITLEELLNLGNSIREYLRVFKEPFVDIEGDKTAKLFEWENGEGVRFRIATDKIKGEGLPKTPLSPSDEIIITFYSDRNLKEQMDFKNPKVIEYYQNQDLISNDLLSKLEANQQTINQSPRVDEILKNQDSTNNLKISLGLDKELDDSNKPSNPNNSNDSNNKRKSK